MPWAYALVAPLSFVVWWFFASILAWIPGVSLFGVFVGPPVSAVLYVWQRGRVATVAEPPSES
ncbi:hypothetical protein C440_04968 [Haloferax mucosum ATCC BAA-1512]|uniref:Uncharacterized protein n=2 Tax=Haloferax mucosum TaxID=403181 RepID=M0II70_9EURY|nr:hypothetical protein C440_04968 [Haloferax mucosum ATCC BAA-1512]